jgi:hypothetical protein
MTLWTFLVIGWAIAYATRKTPVDPDVEFERTHPRPPLRPQPSKTRVCAPAPAKPPSTVAHPPKPVTVFAPVVAPKLPTAKAPVVVTVSTQIRLDALAALRCLGYSQKDAQAQLDTSLGLAIQQSLQRG